MTMMSRDDAIEFLSVGTRTGKLATASPTGAPHVAPVWFVVDGDDLVFNTGEGTVKGKHLLANPRAALTVDVDVYPYSFVIVRGPVTIDESADDLLEWATKIAARYVPAGQAESYGKRNAVPGELLVRLRMDRVIGERDLAN
jgi:PPOX class probable F420-dependent enzyme